MAYKTHALDFLYQNALGRMLLKPLTSPAVSRMVAAYMNSSLSRARIKPFVRKSGIDMSVYEQRPFRSFNDFFTRRRPDADDLVDPNPRHLISPCDGHLLTYPIDGDRRFAIKGVTYTTCELLNGDSRADVFGGGLCLVFRLDVDDYHRYCYPDDGTKGPNTVIPGRLHTVKSVSADHPIYRQNAREVTLLETAHFGSAAMVEVGAMMVGRICNHHQSHSFRRGEEKGYFEFGGSTIVLLLRAGAVIMDAGIDAASAAGAEIRVRYGQRIGTVREIDNKRPPVSV